MEDDIMNIDNEAEELEQTDEADELEQPETEENQENLDEATSSVKVNPKTHVRRNPNLNLNVNMLTGPRGIHTIENYFKNETFRGKGYEKYDLDNIMKKLELWSHRVHSKYNFDENLLIIENFGKKREIQAHMTKYRRNMLEHQIQQSYNSNDEDADEINKESEPFDEMDELLDMQIQNSKINQSHDTSIRTLDSGIRPLADTSFDNLMEIGNEKHNQTINTTLSDDQLNEIERKRQIAKQKLMANRNLASQNNSMQSE